MADYGGFNIPSPQEVLARIQAQRDQFRQSGDPAVRRQATFDTALDALLGNPQVEAARRVTNAVNEAQQKLEPVAGEDDLDTELRRLKAIRDSVQNLDPSVASQVNMQMLKLGQEKLERAKLLADTQYRANEDRRQESAEQRQAGLYGLDVAAKATQIEKDQSETQNYINPRTGELVNVAALDSIAVKRLQDQGWVKVGTSVQVDDPKKLAGNSKQTDTDLQKAVISSQNQLDALRATIQKYDPKFLQLPTQVLNSAMSIGEKLGLNVPQSADRKKYYEFRRNATDGLNRYINLITGAAVGIKEEERIRKAFPDPEKDGNTEFMSKLRETVRSIMGVQKRAQQMLSNGVRSVNNREEWDSIATPPVSDAEVETFMSGMFGTPAPKSAAPSGSPAKSSLDSRIDDILKAK